MNKIVAYSPQMLRQLPTHQRVWMISVAVVFLYALHYLYFSSLQIALNKLCIIRSPERAKRLCSQIGRTLLSLRGGIAMRSTKINSAASKHTCIVLYFYYLAIRSRLPSHVSPEDLDTEQVMFYGGDEKLPRPDSIKGYEAWLERGTEMYRGRMKIYINLDKE